MDGGTLPPGMFLGSRSSSAGSVDMRSVGDVQSLRCYLIAIISCSISTTRMTCSIGCPNTMTNRAMAMARALPIHDICVFRGCLPNKNAGCRFLRVVIRHCSRCAAKTELCVILISFEALVSFDSKVFTACPGSDQLIHSADLAVDLFNRSSNPETRRR